MALVLTAVTAGATVTVLVVYDSVIKRPLPGTRANEVLSIGGLAYGMSNPVNWWGRAPGVEYISSYRTGDAEVACPGLTRWMRVAEVSGSFFPIFDGVVTAGRAIGAQDEHDDVAAIVVGADIWRQLDRSQGLGRITCRVGSATATVVGVVDSSLQFPSAAQVWIPRAMNEAVRPTLVTGAPGLPPVRSQTGWIVLPKSGIGATQIQDEMLFLLSEANSVLSRKTGVRYGDIVQVDPLVSQITRTIRPGLVALMASASIAFLLCLGTVVVHSMSRLQARRRELAIQMCLGAPRHHGALAIAAEAALIALASSGLILLTTAGLLQLARTYLGGFRAYLAQDQIMWISVIVTTLVATGLAVGATVLGGFIAQRFVSPLEAAQGIAGTGIASSGAQTTRRLFIGLSAAVATALVAGALVANSALIQLLNLDLGYSQTNVATITLGLQRSTINGPAFAARRAEIAALAKANGLTRIGYTNRLPVFSADRGYVPLGTSDRTIMMAISQADAGFFEALGIPLRGTGLSGAPDEVVLNRAAAQRLGGETDLLGSTLYFDRHGVPQRVVGIVDETWTVDQGRETVPQVYRPLEEVDGASMPTASVVVELFGHVRAGAGPRWTD